MIYISKIFKHRKLKKTYKNNKRLSHKLKKIYRFNKKMNHNLIKIYRNIKRIKQILNMNN